MKMGIGQLGRPDLIYKRQFRWTFEVVNLCGNLTIPENFVKSTARPNLDVEETSVDFLNVKMFLPGKAVWQTIDLTYYDVAVRDLDPLWAWVCSVYNVCDTREPEFAHRSMGSQVGDYAGLGLLTLYDGCGAALERWKLHRCWPKAIDFGPLDYSSSEVCEVKMTLRYMDVTYEPICPMRTLPQGCCTPCR